MVGYLGKSMYIQLSVHNTAGVVGVPAGVCKTRRRVGE